MNRERASNLSTRTGGFLGLAAFVIYGLKPALVYGGLMGVVIAAGLHGGPIGDELSTRIIVAGGMLIGVLAVGFIMTVLGGILGAFFYNLVLSPIADKRIETPSPHHDEVTPAAGNRDL